VKTNTSPGKRLFVIALATVYIFAISTYIVFLSSRTHTHFHQHKAYTKVQRLSGAGPAGNFYDKQHGAFKTIFRSTQKVAPFLYILLYGAILTPFSRVLPLFLDWLHCVITGLVYAGRRGYVSLCVIRV
jgi:hypothetical protein